MSERHKISKEIAKIHAAFPNMGYRCIRCKLECYHGMNVNDKRTTPVL